MLEIIGGPDRDRTDDLFHAMEARSQLRHRPTLGGTFLFSRMWRCKSTDLLEQSALLRCLNPQSERALGPRGRSSFEQV